MQKASTTTGKEKRSLEGGFGPCKPWNRGKRKIRNGNKDGSSEPSVYDPKGGKDTEIKKKYTQYRVDVEGGEQFLVNKKKNPCESGLGIHGSQITRTFFIQNTYIDRAFYWHSCPCIVKGGCNGLIAKKDPVPKVAKIDSLNQKHFRRVVGGVMARRGEWDLDENGRGGLR